MGERRRERTRDFFSLAWLLDPGRNERREAMDNQENATRLWLDLMRNSPGAEYLDVNPGYSAAQSLSGDAAYQAGGEAQMRALRQMQGIAEGGGYTQLERDQIAQAQRQAAQYEQAQRAAQMQALQARGMGGSGAEIAMRAQAQQSGANQARQGATQIATAAQQRALQAMQNQAQIGQGVQQTRERRASAIDEFNRANAQGTAQARQQAYLNRANALAGATGQYNTNAGNAIADANRQAQQTQGLITSIIGAVA